MTMNRTVDMHTGHCGPTFESTSRGRNRTRLRTVVVPTRPPVRLRRPPAMRRSGPMAIGISADSRATIKRRRQTVSDSYAGRVGTGVSPPR